MSKRKIAIVVGILILVAYTMLIGESEQSSRVFVMFGDVISGLAVIGIAVLMFPLLKSYGKKLSLGYAWLKYVEGGIMVIAGILFLFLDPGVRYWIYFFHAYIFAVSALFFYILLYRSNLIPKFISVWGAIAAVLVVAINLAGIKIDPLPMVVSAVGLAPIILNEAFLALWLIFKGFNKK